LKQWHFAPAQLMLGRPVRQRSHIHVHFDPAVLDRDEVKSLLIEAGEHGARIFVLARPPQSGPQPMSSSQ